MTLVYDVIVVGAGAAGAPLAARLSEDPGRTVLLLEAGPVPATTDAFPADLLRSGTVQGAMPGYPENWSFMGNLTPHLPYSIARGRILGGSSTINGAYFVRGRVQDFERWSAGGNDEWAWENVVAAYRRLEHDRQFGETTVHGGSGPVPVSRPPQNHPVTVAFAAACKAAGFAEEPDKNDQSAPGYGPVPMNAVDGIRINTGIAYINPVRDRSNLTVQGDTYVRRVLVDALPPAHGESFDHGARASGVEVERDGVVSSIHAREVILAAGGVKSPHILLVSGIGPAAELQRFGIEVVADLPGVGIGFTDHPEVSVGWRSRRNIVDYTTSQSMADVLNFTATDSELVGDLEILPMLKPTGYLLTGSAAGAVSGVQTFLRHPLRALRAMRGISWRRFAQQVRHRADLTFLVAVQAETSRGEITLQSADPAVQPKIDYNYLSTESDRRRMREAVRTTVSLVRSESFHAIFDRLTELTDAIIDDDVALDEWLLGHLGTAIHLCGSAKFGAVDDPASVVDQFGRVHGVRGLRVADTSILPTTPTRGPAATAVLIGERIAEFVRRGD